LDEHGLIALPDGINLSTLLEKNIADFGHALAYRYVEYSHQPDGNLKELTWDQVGTRSRAIGARLQQVTSRGDRVAILCPQGLDYVTGFFAAIQAGNIAVPLFAPELPGHAERLDAVVTDCQPAVVLTTTAVGDAVQKFVRLMPREKRPRIIAVDAIPDTVESTFAPVEMDSDEIAYLQYTSGSTRTPTGVEISHRAAGTNLLQMVLSIGLEGDFDINGVSWLPLYHDMGLMMIGFPLLYGGHLTFMSPMAFVRRPLRWIQVLASESRNCHIVSPAPNFAFDLVAQRGMPSSNSIDLSNVVFINGSEPVNLESIMTFTEAFLPYGLTKTAVRPSYGMAEAALFVSSIRPYTEPTAVYLDREQLGCGRAVRVEADAPNALAQVSCGEVAVSQWAAIADPDTGQELPDERVGEIWLHGDNIGRGYWARPEETEYTFGNKLQSRLDSGSHAEGAKPDATWLRTGDLGCYIDGDLYITGRIKDMVIVDGRNHYPQDIEATVQEAHALIRFDHVAAFALTVDGEDRLVIVAEHSRHITDPGAERDAATRAVRNAVVVGHGAPVHDFVLVPPDTVPRTSSGKVARGACRQRYLAGTWAETVHLEPCEVGEAE
jgi:fatty-acyl-CoA synthase